MAELSKTTRDALLRLARTKAGEPLDLKALLVVGDSAGEIVDALFESDARRLAAEEVPA